VRKTERKVSAKRRSVETVVAPTGFDPCFSLERIVSRTVATGTYGAVATGGCHGASEFECFVI